MSVDAAIISGLLTNLAPLITENFSFIWNFEEDVQKLSSTLSSLQAVLEDAERRIKHEEKDKQTEDWLRKLKGVAYEVRDIMDDCTFEDLRLQVKRLNASSSTRIQVTNCIAHPFKNTWTRIKIGHKIKDVLKKLVQISFERNNLHLREIIPGPKSTSWRETMSKLSEKVYGRDKEKEKIVDILIHATEKLSVLPIIGHGGLGKTTLAQMIFNDEEITKCFDVKHWVCVSEELDIKLVIKAILGVKDETSLETLQNQIQNNLRGKKYLIVLDDVWNENIDEWNKLRSILDCGLSGAFIITTTRKRNVAEIMKTQGIQPFDISLLSNDDCWQLFEERAFMYGIPKSTNFIDIGKEIAKKCKGVPLVAKTLGSQLSFKSDEKYWCTIRDSEMWKISENQESILPILKLSYYDLPYLLRRCFVFCAIFPKDTEIEKERLIQLWMAHDLIPINKYQEGEDNGNIIWDELCWRSFFQDEKEEMSWGGKTFQKTCKLHDLMHDLAQFVMKDECYTMDVMNENSSEDFRREIRHITIMMDELTPTSIDSIKKIRGLQSIVFHPEDSSNQILSVLKDLPSLRLFEVSRIVSCQDLCYMGCLKHLRYLNLSSGLVTTLPDSICDLLNLQTLILNYCRHLESLPRNMKDLINLQHLYLDGCRNLRYMPGGMGRLKSLKTLSLVVVGKKNRDCQLDEFKDLEIRGCLKIKNLERVSDASIARGISLAKMSSINELELQWDFNRDNNGQTKARHHEKIFEALEVSSTCLKILKIEGYEGVNIPKLMGESSASLRMLYLLGLDNVEHIFTMNNMSFPLLEELEISNMWNLRELVSPLIPITIGAFPNLRKIDIRGCPKLGALLFMSFPLLEELRVGEMKNLRELVAPLIPITSTIGAFPNLRKIDIHNCPKLGALPPHLKSLKRVSVFGEYSDELINSISYLSGELTHLFLMCVDERSVLSSAISNSNDMNGTGAVTLFPFLEKLVMEDMKNLRELVYAPPIHITTTTVGAFPNLCEIMISRCPKLGALPPNLKSLKNVTIKGDCSEELLYSISDLISGLTHLTFESLGERSVLFEGGNYYKADGNENENEITTASSSTSTLAEDNINEAQGGPAASSTFQSLQRLEIENCPKLSRLFDEKGGEKLARGDSFMNLNRLMIYNCPELMISLEQWRNLCTHSLQDLWINKCPKLSCLFDEERGVEGCLKNLIYLAIIECPELMISLEQWRKLLTHSLQYLSIKRCPKLVPSKVEEANEVHALLRSLRERLGRRNFRVDILNEEQTKEGS